MNQTSNASLAISDPSRVGTRLLVLATAGVAALAFMLVTAIALLSGASLGAGDIQSTEADGGAASALAVAEIPPAYLRLYQRAAQRYGVSWAILAGIGRVECDHGRGPDPSCTQEGAVNSAGAGGPMQFIASTWARFGVDAEGNGPPDRWNPPDAIFAAANLLRASGAPADYARAIFAYNHASWYVAEVESWARKYSAAAFAQPAAGEGGMPEGADAALVGESPTPVLFVPGQHAELAAGDGHLALVPAGVPATVQAMVVAGNELQDLPYGPDGHPDPLGAAQEDCSSSVNYVLYRAGVRPLEEILRENPLAQDYVNWGAPGPGRWVTIYATDSPTAHVFMLIAGLRLDTSHDGTDIGPNRYEDGPRWRIFDHIPAWAHWSVRHPPGL
jgi:hypothetical protein